MESKTYSESLTSCVDVYNANGLSLVSMPYGEKGPRITNWGQLQPDPERINPDNDNQNIGVVLGENSGGLVDIDIDCPEAVLAAKHLLPDTGMIFGRDSAGDSHYLYRTDGPIKTKRFQSTDKRTILEIRGDRAQTVVPPSFHRESGEFRRWRKLDGIAKVDLDDLSNAACLVAACVDIAPAFVEGSRHDLYLALAGVLKRQGYPLDTAQGVVKALVEITRDNDLADRLRACRDTYEKDEADKTTGIPMLLKLAGEHGEAFLRRLEIQSCEPATHDPAITADHEYLSDPALNKNGHLCTDGANGSRFAKCYHGELAFTGKGSWLRFDGKRWVSISQEELKKYAHKVAHDLQRELSSDDPRYDHMKSWSVASLGNARLDAMIENAMPYLKDDRSSFDAKESTAHLINFRNGTFDVAKGELRKHSAADRLTKLIDHGYVPAAQCPKFLAFLSETFQGDKSLIDYVLTIFGYALTGFTSEQKMFFFWGTGANGKSTLTDLVKSLIGEYAAAVDPAVIMEKTFSSSGPSPEVARLAGLRLGIVSEGDQNQKIASGIIKRLTGDATMTARFNYQNPFEFKPQVKLTYQTNHLPKIDSTDDAIWRRLKLVPFNNVVPEEKRNGNLLAELEAEAEGILALLVEHARNWYLNGFPKCETVDRFGEGTRNDLDTVGQFIRDRLEPMPGAKTPCSEMYRAYEEFCRREGLEALPKQKFNNIFALKGFEKGKSGVDVWKGVILSQDHYLPASDAGLDDVI